MFCASAGLVPGFAFLSGKGFCSTRAFTFRVPVFTLAGEFQRFNKADLATFITATGAEVPLAQPGGAGGQRRRRVRRPSRVRRDLNIALEVSKNRTLPATLIMSRRITSIW